jgi:prepilin-type processing-associated H-X9-DG protein
MYKIQGADQKEYGPVGADVIREWIAQRRIDGRTLVQAEGTTPWRTLAEFPEFSAALARMSAPPPPPGQMPSAAGAQALPEKTSGLAITSLVLGVLGLCGGLTSLFGLIFGIVALSSISKSQGRLTGKGMAIAGICLSSVFLVLFVLMLPATMLPALAKAKQRAQTINCVSNLKQLALGVRMYSNDNKDTFPAGDSWCDSIQSYVGRPSVYQCKADRTGQRCNYAINQKVAGKKENEINPQTVMLFEIDGGWNVAGGPELLARRSRHGNIVNVAFADGSVQQMSPSRLSTLRWDP